MSKLTVLGAFTEGFAESFGFWFLWLPCLLHAWTEPDLKSIKPIDNKTYPQITGARYTVDQWRWKWLRPWFNNVEDGVSGQQAFIWNAGGTAYIPYASTFPTWTPKWVIAFAWSAWRNGANNIKRRFR